MTSTNRATQNGNLILTGFMGTGKTTVGRILARRLNRPFLDCDDLIEERAGMTISEIFTSRGEAAFRQLETGLCRELNGQSGLVIATGGGMLIDPVNRQLMEGSGRVICLLTTPEAAVERLAGRDNRPLLAESDQLAAARQILEKREAIYNSFEWRVETAGRAPEEVADEALRLWETRRPIVHGPTGDYSIHIQESILARLGQLVANLGRRGRIVLVSNPTVWELYGVTATQSLESAGFDVTPCPMPDGEEHKTLETVARLYEDFLNAGLDRSGTVVALGGGVVGDVAGFAAATFMRGIPVVQVPTTLLSMIDSSVGGKTGVDLPRGKNLVGAFHHPILVVIDPDVLSTLPAQQIGCGLAETLKAGIIADSTLYDLLLAGPPFPWTEVLERALRVKIDVVEEDPYEAGRRAVLNLGHTAGHALERLSGYGLLHGEAVAVGLVIATHIAVDMKVCESDLPAHLQNALHTLNLPATWAGPHSPDEVLAAMAHDKKRRRGRQRWILPRRIGEVEIVEDVPDEIILSALEQTREPVT